MTNDYEGNSPESNHHKQHLTFPPNCQNVYDVTTLPSSILRWIDDNMAGYITLWDKNGILIYISKTIEHALGYSVSELVGLKWHELIPAEDVSYIKRHLDTTRNDKQIFNINMQNKYGNRIWTENHVTALDDEQGNRYVIAATKDITDKKEAEEMMIRSEKMSVAGQLAAGIAHEIRNPLTSLRGFLQLLQAGVDRTDAYHQIMIDEIEKMETITSELLFMSKPMTEHKEMVSIFELIEDVVTLLKPQARLKNVEIALEQTNSPSVSCDRSQIKQVFINLLKNAVEAMDNPGRITITDQLRDKDVLIDVTDEGPGIDENVIHKLEEPFFTTKQNGTGLGLMITRQILERHRGNLEILGNEGNGSTFRVILPLPN